MVGAVDVRNPCDVEVDGEFVGLIVVLNPCDVAGDGEFVGLIVVLNSCDVEVECDNVGVAVVLNLCDIDMEAEFVLVVVDGEFVGLIVVRNPCNVVLEAIFDPCDVDVAGDFVQWNLGNVLCWLCPKNIIMSFNAKYIDMGNFLISHVSSWRGVLDTTLCNTCFVTDLR